MAINFPNAPIVGNTYDYLGVRYTWFEPSAGLGLWKATTPGSVGIASSAEITAGTDPIKYLTPASVKNAQLWQSGGQVVASAVELNNMDGGTGAASITALGTDKVVYNDGGVMKQVALSTLDTYFKGTKPVVSAFLSANISNPVDVVVFNTENFDSHAYYNNVTGRFLPLRAGIYRITMYAYWYTVLLGGVDIAIRKNGTDILEMKSTTKDSNEANVITKLVEFNGSTDYVEIFSAFTGTLYGNGAGTGSNFEAEFVRGVI